MLSLSYSLNFAIWTWLKIDKKKCSRTYLHLDSQVPSPYLWMYFLEQIPNSNLKNNWTRGLHFPYWDAKKIDCDKKIFYILYVWKFNFNSSFQMSKIGLTNNIDCELVELLTAVDSAAVAIWQNDWFSPCSKIKCSSKFKTQIKLIEITNWLRVGWITNSCGLSSGCNSTAANICSLSHPSTYSSDVDAVYFLYQFCPYL